MSPIAHDARGADAAAEKAALRAFQRKVVRVTLLVLVVVACLVGFSLATRWLTGAVYEASGQSLLASVALRIVLGLVLAEVVVRVMLRMRGAPSDSAWYLRWFYFFCGFQIAAAPRAPGADPLWIHATVLVVVGAGLVGTALMRRRA